MWRNNSGNKKCDGQFPEKKTIFGTNCVIMTKCELFTVTTIKQWNGKTTLQQFLIVFDVLTNQMVLPDTNLVKWVCFHSKIAVSHAHWTF